MIDENISFYLQIIINKVKSLSLSTNTVDGRNPAPVDR